jgi:hypothetical protein
MIMNLHFLNRVANFALLFWLMKKAERHLTHLTELGLIDRKGAGPGTYYEFMAT